MNFIDIIDSNVNIANMTFSNNNAYNGGAISIYCNYLIPCSNQISGWEFNNNTASNDGGAIDYNSYSPTMVSFYQIYRWACKYIWLILYIVWIRVQTRLQTILQSTEAILQAIQSKFYKFEQTIVCINAFILILL